uniref:NADH-ubiquinone oxidoreductase chain 4 n=1 Tax=Colponema vietnamica TaxID=1492817 RepID=V5KVE9_9ALVE|nr:NADH dehydrogenase subunit 4 [Colponema vietnamica]ATY40861.1 NADH dehydrogenase subunit 4 [Colponema vietnamica]
MFMMFQVNEIFLLKFIIVLPFIMGYFTIFTKNVKLVKQLTLFTVCIIFISSLYLLFKFNPLIPGYQFVFHFLSNPSYDSNILNLVNINNSFFFGIDNIALIFILLTTFLFPLVILIGWSINKQTIFFFQLLLILEGLLLIVFSTLNILLFYISFEFILIPMALMIGIWGSRQRKIRATYFFLLYTLLGSLPLLIAILAFYHIFGTFNILFYYPLNNNYLLWILIFLAFAVKTPLFPFHRWLPEAHVEAPTVGSVLLAGILLKLGGFGFLRYLLPLLPEASATFKPLIYTLGILGIIYISIITIIQTDLKKIIAYSSVAHMGLATMGLFTENVIGVNGSIFVMISHGLVSAGLFFAIGVLYEQHHSRLIYYYGGLVNYMPLYVCFLGCVSFANMGFPGTSAFIGEFLILQGLLIDNFIATFLAATGVVLSAIYSLFLFNRVSFGYPKQGYIKIYKDLSRLQFYIGYIFVFYVILLGIYPNIVLYLL